jgi:hypothetical protein
MARFIRAEAAWFNIDYIVMIERLNDDECGPKFSLIMTDGAEKWARSLHTFDAHEIEKWERENQHEPA